MKVIAKSNIQHDGELFVKGQELEVSEKQAADLLAVGVIEAVQGLKPTPKEDVGMVSDQDEKKQEDVKEISKNIEEVANLPIKAVGMKKTALIGIARANGLVVENTATPTEVYNMIKAFREKGKVVEDAKQPEGDEGKAQDPETPEDVKE